MATADKIIICTLREPHKGDCRRDPFWECGSFGRTGCHNRNLMNPNKGHELPNTRIAFAQAGPSGRKLVFLTPPIQRAERQGVGNLLEIVWEHGADNMPLRYDSAPTLVPRGDEGDWHFPAMKDVLARARRSTPYAKFSSKFRSRRAPLGWNKSETELAQQIVTVYGQYRKKGNIAENWWQAAANEGRQEHNPNPDCDRRKAYDNCKNVRPGYCCRDDTASTGTKKRKC